MSKRFTDTDKWKKRWLRVLPPYMKLFWLYICDNCNHAGVWDVDLDMASYILGFECEESEILLHLKEHIQKISDSKWYVVDFNDFQYGKLNKNNRTHASVISILNKYNILDDLPF